MSDPAGAVPGATHEPGTVASRAAPATHAVPGALAASEGAFLGWVAVAAVAGAGVVRSDPPVDTPSAVHVALAFGRLAALGGLVALLVGVFERVRPDRVHLARFAAFVTSIGLAWLPVRDDFSNFAGRHEDAIPPEAIYALAAIALGGGVLVAIELGRALRRPWGRALAAVAAVLVAWNEPTILAGQYPALHFFALAVAATLLGSALTSATVAGAERARRVIRAAAAVSLAVLVIPIGADARYRLARDGDVLTPFVAALGSDAGARSAATGGAPRSEWYRPRAGMPPRPPTRGPRFADAPIVLLVTVDCMRFDLVGGLHPRATLPNLERIAREAIVFEHAYAAGASTAYSLSALFAAKPYSLLEWTRNGEPYKFPTDDATPRFPALLSRAGVWTVHAASMNWLVNERGVVRGFEVVDYDAIPGPRWKPAAAVTDRLVARLGEVGDRRAFLYAHYTEPHHPYDAGSRRGSAFERYVGEVALVDREIGRLLEAIDRLGLRDRTLLVVTADHGEAFGEHGRNEHGNSLYDEVLHVPLLVRVPGAAARTVATPVSLMDLGPTLLDLFGQPVPAEFMGESLYPVLAGGEVSPTRPIVAQRGRQRALVTQDLVKAIADASRGVIETYDLRADPRERVNLAGSESATRTSREAHGALEAYFEVHRFRRDGYVEPFRAF